MPLRGFPRHPVSFAGAIGTIALAVAATARHAPLADLRGGTERQSSGRTEVLILGTYHFADPGLDVVKYPVADVLSRGHQADIARLVKQLGTWAPTKIAVEATRDRQGTIDSLYAAYRRGEHALSRNEREQLGFRLAAALNQARVYAIDQRGDFPFGPVMKYAEQHDPGYVKEFEAWVARQREVEDSLQRHASVSGILRFLNAPDAIRANHERYLLDARVGAGDTQVGATLLSAWYDRNIRIFTNLLAIAEPGDRVLLIIGAGHVPILRELVAAMPDFTVVDPMPMIPSAAVLSGGAAEGEAPDLAGLWETRISDVSVAGALVLRKGEDGAGTARGLGFTVKAVFAGDSVRFVVDGRGTFRGLVDWTTHEITGYWIESRTDLVPSPLATPVHLRSTGPGTYSGVLHPYEVPYRLFLQIDHDSGGRYRARFRNPNRNHRGPASEYRLLADGTALTFEPVAGNAGALVAEYQRDPARIRVHWGQVGRTVVLSKTDSNTSPFWPRADRGASYRYRVPPAGADGWTVGPAAAQGIDETLLTDLVREIASTDVRAPNTRLVHSVMIARHGTLVLDEYFFGYDADTPHDLRSGSKSFTSLMFGIASDRGLVHVEDRAAAFFPGRPSPWARDPASPNVGQLLSHTSGLACDDNDSESPGNEGTMQDGPNPDWYGFTLALPLVHPPGTQYAYCTAGMNLVGGVISAATGQWLPDFFQRAVAAPLDVATYHMNLMPDGQAYAGGGIHMRPRDFLKLGQLYLDGGTWHGKPIVSEAWVRRSTAPQADPGNPRSDGFGWHRDLFHVNDRDYWAFEANGNGGQFVIVIPDLDLVVGFTGGNYGMYGVWRHFRDDIVPRLILPAVKQGR